MKAMDEEKWIAEMRERMKDYSEPLPEGLWEELEKDLNTPKIFVLRRKWYAAAVVVLLLASSVTVWFMHSPTVDVTNQEVAMQDVVSPHIEDENIFSGTSAVTEHTLADALSYIQKKHSAPSHAVTLINLSLSSTDNDDTESEHSESSSIINEEKSDRQIDKDKTGNSDNSWKASRAADKERMRRNAYELKSRNERKKEKFSMGLLAGNIPYSSSTTYSGMGSLVSAAYSSQVRNLMGEVGDKTTAESQMLFENSGVTTQTSVNHHLPVTVGASFLWNMNENWALETGLMYTLLVSDLHTGGTAYKDDKQRLHYVGIPLKVQRSIWKNNRFAFYGSAGGAVEKCVSGNVRTVWVTSGGTSTTEETTSLDIDQLQWSVTAALGVQVNFTSQLGLYVEPGMAYYFDDNSDVETIRKEHPFNFNLQLGLRFSIGK